MGTSGSYEGPGNGNPLIPSWLEAPAAPVGAAPQAAPGLVPPQPLTPQPNRFTAPRTNFSRFATSGGRDRAALGRAIRAYVSSSSGGSQTASQRMGAARPVAGQLLNFWAQGIREGAQAALRAVNLEALADRPLEEVFLALADVICPDGATLDEAIARNAFIDTVVDLPSVGITTLEFSPTELRLVLELYIAHSIEARLCNDIGANTLILPRDVAAAANVQAQVWDFVRRGVSDALAPLEGTLHAIGPHGVTPFIARLYGEAFAVLGAMGDQIAGTT